MEEGERRGEAKDHFASVLEGSVRFAHSDGAVRFVGSKLGLRRIVRDVYTRRYQGKVEGV
jgi:predicted TPR repeat methyltransferase